MWLQMAEKQADTLLCGVRHESATATRVKFGSVMDFVLTFIGVADCDKFHNTHFILLTTPKPMLMQYSTKSNSPYHHLLAVNPNAEPDQGARIS
jgi:hypothetical protein